MTNAEQARPLTSGSSLTVSEQVPLDSISLPSASLQEVIGAYLAAHPEQGKGAITSALAFLAQLLALEFADVERAVQDYKRSTLPQKERVQQLLSSVPAVYIDRTGSARRLLYPPYVSRAVVDRERPLSPSSVRTYRSRILLVLDWYQGRKPVPAPGSVRSQVVTPAWHAMIRAAGKVDRHGASTRVARFAIYCEALEIVPENVNKSTTKGFFAYMRDRSGLKMWENCYYRLAGDWAELVAAGEARHIDFFRLGPRHSQYALSPADTPRHLREPFERFERLATSKQACDRPSGHRLKPNTILGYASAYYKFLGALHLSGVDLESVAVNDLFNGPKYLEILWGFWMSRSHGKVISWHLSYLTTLRCFARDFIAPRYGCVDTEWIDSQLRRTAKPQPVRQPESIQRGDIDRMEVYLQNRIDHFIRTKASPRSLLPVVRNLICVRFLNDRANRGFDILEARFVNGLPEKPGHDPGARAYISVDPPYECRFRTKSNIVDRVIFPPGTRDLIPIYLQLRDKLGESSDSFLVSSRGGRLHAKGLYESMKSTAAAVGFNMPPHDFRRVFVTEELERGTDLETVKLLIGSDDSQVLMDSYENLQSIEASRTWNSVGEAHLSDSPQALPLWQQRLLDRAGREPQVLEELRGRMEEDNVGNNN